jgi:hypothetical protein
MLAIIQDIRNRSVILAVLARIVWVLVLSSGLFAAPAPTPVQLRISSIPSDNATALQLTISAISFVATDGSTADLVASPLSIEFKHLELDSEPLVVGSLYPLSYKKAVITVTSSTVSYLRNGIPVRKTVDRTFTSVIRFIPPVIVEYGTPTVLNLELDMSSTIVAGLNGNFRVARPVFRLAAMTAVSPELQKPESGRVDRVMGSVSSVSGSTFTILDGQTGATLTFDTDDNTQFINGGLSTLPGLITTVKGFTKPDGSLQASAVEVLESSMGIVIEGIATRRVPKTTQFLLVSQGGSGYQVSGSLGSTVLADRAQSVFIVDSQEIDMTGLSFLKFNSNSMLLGQNIQVQSIRQMQAGSLGAFGALAADYVRLEPQSITGVVTNYQAGAQLGTASFDLLLPTNGSSYLSVLNPGLFTVHVFQQVGTDLQNLPNGVSNGQSISLRGLLFFNVLPNSTSGRTAVMVAGRISCGQ